MGADISRVGFRPHNDYSGVVLQQGRVLLDADWNKLVTILERRVRASVADLGGRPVPGIQGVAVVPRTTPDGFQLSLSAGELTIGRGRMYVDGLLVENHGGPPELFDPMLAEAVGSTDLSYAQQPYLRDLSDLPKSGIFLAYLDVWQREVTHLEAPELVGPAIGTDTTARTQTVWQVRLHRLDHAAAPIDRTTPDAAIPGWSALIAPSGGRLTADTSILETDTGLGPAPEGYLGLESKTYRVEVHRGGHPGSATFKWSRENGSVASRVLEVLDGGLTVRVAPLRSDVQFRIGDWVELIDDHRELAGLPGELRRIEREGGEGTLAVSAPLPTDLRLDAESAVGRHLRVRLWNQSGTISSTTGETLGDLDAPGASGAIEVPDMAATQVALEHGLVVSFQASGEAPLRTGDYWIVSARPLNAGDSRAPVPLLKDAPPLGIHHHYARLGVLTFPEGVIDHRTYWPAD